jgi:hypothetical protein
LVRDPLLPHPHGTSPSVRCHLRRGRTGKTTPHALPRAPPCWLFPLPIPMQRHCLPPPPHTLLPYSSTPSLPSPQSGSPQPCSLPPRANNISRRSSSASAAATPLHARTRFAWVRTCGRLDSDLRLGARGMASRSGGERRSGVDLPSVLFRRKDAFSRTARSRFFPPPPLFLVGRSPALLASLSLCTRVAYAYVLAGYKREWPGS